MEFLIHNVTIENLKTGSTRKGYGHYNAKNKLLYMCVGTFRLDGTPMVLDLPFKIQNAIEVKAQAEDTVAKFKAQQKQLGPDIHYTPPLRKAHNEK